MDLCRRENEKENCNSKGKSEDQTNEEQRKEIDGQTGQHLEEEEVGFDLN